MRKYEQQANGNARQGQQQRRGPSEKPEGCTSVFIGNLSWNIDEDTIRQAFASCGEVRCPCKRVNMEAVVALRGRATPNTPGQSPPSHHHHPPPTTTIQVTGVRFATDRETGEFRGFGHVDFADENGPEAAVAMAGTPVSV